MAVLLRCGCLLLCGLLLVSCIISRHPAGIAGSTAPLSEYIELGPVEESSCGYWVLFLPLGGKDPTDEIIARVTKARGASALIGVTVEVRNSTFALPLFGSECTIVKGTAVRRGQEVK